MHTHAPWQAVQRKRTLMICDENGNFIAAIKPVKRFGINGDDKSNAAVIAAAPKLLEALRATTDRLVMLQGENAPCVAEARAAIAKATTP